MSALDSFWSSSSVGIDPGMAGCGYEFIAMGGLCELKMTCNWVGMTRTRSDLATISSEPALHCQLLAPHDERIIVRLATPFRHPLNRIWMLCKRKGVQASTDHINRGYGDVLP